MNASSDRNFANSLRDQTTWSRSSALNPYVVAKRRANVLLPEPELPKTRILMAQVWQESTAASLGLSPCEREKHGSNHSRSRRIPRWRRKHENAPGRRYDHSRQASSCQ